MVGPVKGMAGCSAVFIGPNEALTAAHCFESPIILGMWEKDSSGVSQRITLKKLDAKKDLALIYIPGPAHKYAKLGSTPSRDSRVYAISSPLGFAKTWSKGYVCNVVNLSGRQLIFHTAVIAPGSSGSGLYNYWGHLVGINTMIAYHYSIAVGLDDIKEFLHEAN